MQKKNIANRDIGAASNFASPLRYPGGKSKISSYLEDLILLNNLEGCTFYELYAGGAGAALNLLFSGVVEKIVLNDLDLHIYNFWLSVLNQTDDFIRLINTTKVDIDTWDKQKAIYIDHENHTPLEVGFSAFFLNRCNRSGILYKAGPIGGRDQTGNYKIDVRFNKIELCRRIEKIATLKKQIQVTNQESITLLKSIFSQQKEKRFVFLDPPYYDQGENLYLSFYKDSDHVNLRDLLKEHNDEMWFLTYDNSPRIIELYASFIQSDLPMTYTLQAKKKSKEVMMFSKALYLPKMMRLGSKSVPLIIN